MTNNFNFSQPQPDPIPRPDQTAVADLVVRAIQERLEFGKQKYGTPLTADNGRDHLVDAYQEALDLAIYLRAEIERRAS